MNKSLATSSHLKNLWALSSGLVFGVGLIIAEMVNPAKVVAFLDLGGAWDPSLALVMAAAILIGLPTFWFAKRRSQSVCGDPFNWPTSTVIDRRLIGGSLAFGAGWGLAGLCPGPALVTAASGNLLALLFVAAMLVGFWGFWWLEQRVT
ncbi:MAG: DUF6691 family protein [Pseudomonadota bacterium]|nr:DUF6691 family protein [Pseudomonadota bacterium]